MKSHLQLGCVSLLICNPKLPGCVRQQHRPEPLTRPKQRCNQWPPQGDTRDLILLPSQQLYCVKLALIVTLVLCLMMMVEG